MADTAYKRRNKVVGGFDIFFADDLSINDAEISRKIGLPMPMIAAPDELIIIAGDSLHTLTEGDGQDYMKFYGLKFGITKKGPVADAEKDYFAANTKEIDDLKKNLALIP